VPDEDAAGRWRVPLPFSPGITRGNQHTE
jgi:hypothetical protein